MIDCVAEIVGGHPLDAVLGHQLFGLAFVLFHFVQIGLDLLHLQFQLFAVL
jgi:hypothetical protein